MHTSEFDIFSLFSLGHCFGGVRRVKHVSEKPPKINFSSQRGCFVRATRNWLPSVSSDDSNRTVMVQMWRKNSQHHSLLMVNGKFEVTVLNAMLKRWTDTRQLSWRLWTSQYISALLSRQSLHTLNEVSITCQEISWWRPVCRLHAFAWKFLNRLVGPRQGILFCPTEN